MAPHYVRTADFPYLKDRNDHGLNKEHTVTYNLVAAGLEMRLFQSTASFRRKEMRKVRKKE